MLQRDRHPNLDFFVADMWAWPVKDDQMSMEHPVFALGKITDREHGVFHTLLVSRKKAAVLGDGYLFLSICFSYNYLNPCGKLVLLGGLKRSLLVKTRARS